MKASELIKELEKAIAEHGDLDVVYQCKHWWLAEVETIAENRSRRLGTKTSHSDRLKPFQSIHPP